MDKRQLIEAIRQFNPSATEAFLEQFDVPALEQYRARLADTQRPRAADFVLGPPEGAGIPDGVVAFDENDECGMRNEESNY